MLIAAPQVSFQVSELQKASLVFTSGFGAEDLQKLRKASGMTQSTAQAGQANLNLRIKKTENGATAQQKLLWIWANGKS